MLLKVLADLLQNIYPERFGKLYIVNAPVFFNAAWAIIKVWLDKRIIEKVQVLGSDYAKVLNKDIDHHQFPDFLGGSCTCSHLDGGCVPPTKNSVKGDTDAFLFKMAMKKSSNTHEHEVAMPEGGKLNFKFASSAEFKLEIKCAETNETFHEVSHTEASGSIDLKSGRYVAVWKSDSLGSYKATPLQYTLAPVHNVRKAVEVARRVSNVDSAADISSIKGMRLSGTETIIGDDIFYDALEYFETA
jgi:hypothetical protein